MIPALLITLREGLEAALIIGIMLSLLRRLGHAAQQRSVWLGVGTAVLASAAAGLALNAAGLAFEGRAEELFEGITMLLAAVVLTWMIFWMRAQGRTLQTQLEADMRHALSAGSRGALFTLAFVAVVREGIETALFLTATMISTSPAQSLLGAVLGLLIAAALGWLMFVGGRQLNIRAFFNITSAVLLIIAAGLLAHGIHELEEAGLVPVVVEHVWDINHVLDEQSMLGAFLKALVGYNANPSLIESISYTLYLLVAGMTSLAMSRPPAQAGYAA